MDVTAEPGLTSSARTEGVRFDHRRFVQTLGFAALAANHEVGEVPTAAPFVQPELPTAVVLHAVDEPLPIEVVDMAPRTRAHEARRDHGSSVKLPVVERFAVDEAP